MTRVVLDSTLREKLHNLADRDEGVRQVCAWALGQGGPAAESALPALTLALRDDDPDVRRGVPPGRSAASRRRAVSRR